MGKDDKEETGFGFKDKLKAEETLRLLECHDMNYRRLTVRGLLGRAKRVLSLTKAEDKIKNIKEAMEVFESWLADLDKNKQRVDKKRTAAPRDHHHTNKDNSESEEAEVEPHKEKSPTSDSVSGLGFKDKEAAINSLKVLEGRDPDYQKLAVKGLIGRAKRVLTCTRNESKVSNIKEAVSVLDQFLDEFDTMHLSRQNNPYLPLAVVRVCRDIAHRRGVGDEQQKRFIEAYTKVNGEYKKLRTAVAAAGEDAPTWDIVRNTALKTLKEEFAEEALFKDGDELTDNHLRLTLWAYSPEPARVKLYIAGAGGEGEGGRGARKRRGSAGGAGGGGGGAGAGGEHTKKLRE